MQHQKSTIDRQTVAAGLLATSNHAEIERLEATLHERMAAEIAAHRTWQHARRERAAIELELAGLRGEASIAADRARAQLVGSAPPVLMLYAHALQAAQLRIASVSASSPEGFARLDSAAERVSAELKWIRSAVLDPELLPSDAARDVRRRSRELAAQLPIPFVVESEP